MNHHFIFREEQIDNGAVIPEHSCSCGGISGSNYSRENALRMFVAHVLHEAHAAIQLADGGKVLFHDTSGVLGDLRLWASQLRQEANRTEPARMAHRQDQPDTLRQAHYRGDHDAGVTAVPHPVYVDGCPACAETRADTVDEVEPVG